jgi:transposase-like protein
MTKRYSEQFKQESIQYVQNHPESGIATIAKQLGVGLLISVQYFPD